MKKLSRILMLLSVCSVFAIRSNSQEIIVKTRMSHAVVERRPERPSANHVWVAEEWTPGGGSYAYHAGYWAVPPRPHAVWVAGFWKDRRGGYVWIPGHWR